QSLRDDEDVYLEKVDSEGKHVLRGEAWIPIHSAAEEIRLRDGTSVPVKIQWTEIGPLEVHSPPGFGPYSIAWNIYEQGDAIGAFVDLSRAASMDEGMVALDRYRGSSRNVLVAARSGDM